MGEGPDQRDTQNWVVIELTRAGEAKATEGTLDKLLLEALKADPKHPVFVPSVTYSNRGHVVTVALMDGYAFVASGLPETTMYALEHTCPYVRRILTTRSPNGMRVLSVIPDIRVQEMRRQLAEQVSSDIIEGMRVTVTDGIYNHLDGEVVQVLGDNARVRFVMRSLDLIAPVPRVFLTPTTEEEP